MNILATFAFTSLSITILINSSKAYTENDEFESVLKTAPNIKLLVEGAIRTDYTKFHRIQARRIKGHANKKSSVPGMCSFQGRIAIRNECEQYVICQRAGEKSKIGFCGRNKKFHHQLRACRNMTHEECQATMCQTTLDKFPDPYAKENFLGCRAMVPTIHTCPEGKIYKDEEKACVEGSPLAGFKSSYEADQNGKEEADIKTPKPFVKND